MEQLSTFERVMFGLFCVGLAVNMTLLARQGERLAFRVIAVSLAMFGGTLLYRAWHG